MSNKFVALKSGLAYLKNDADVYEKWNVTPIHLSKSMIGVMANIREIKIWANFTYDTDSKKIMVELRSKQIPIQHIAVKYGGGGHLLACGASVDDWQTVDKMIADLDQLCK